MITSFEEYNIINENVYFDYFKVLYNSAPNDLKELIDSTKNAQQNPYWHPEGHTYKHIVLVTNRLHNCYNDINLDLSGLFHDLGKAETTKWDEGKGSWTAHGHEDVSSLIVDTYKGWIKKMGGDIDIIQYVVQNHMRIKYLDEFRLQSKIDLLDSPYIDYLLKFTTADYGGTDLDCKSIMDLTDVKNEIKKFKEKQNLNKEINNKFNGNIVMKLYPDLKGKELGSMLNNFKNYVEDEHNVSYSSYILDNEQQTIINDFKSFINK